MLQITSKKLQPNYCLRVPGNTNTIGTHHRCSPKSNAKIQNEMWCWPRVKEQCDSAKESVFLLNDFKTKLAFLLARKIWGEIKYCSTIWLHTSSLQRKGLSFTFLPADKDYKILTFSLWLSRRYVCTFEVVKLRVALWGHLAKAFNLIF